MTVDQVKQEVMLLDVDNIQKFPIKEGKREDFRNLWLRFGPQAARDIMIPDIWYEKCPLPSEYFGKSETT